MDWAVSPLTLEQWPALEELFGRAGASNGCWCMYWRIGPRYRDRPREENKHDARSSGHAQEPQVRLGARWRCLSAPRWIAAPARRGP